MDFDTTIKTIHNWSLDQGHWYDEEELMTAFTCLRNQGNYTDMELDTMISRINLMMIFEKIAFVNKELGEIAEGIRRGNIKARLEEKMADIIVRLFDLAGKHDLHLNHVIARKIGPWTCNTQHSKQLMMFLFSSYSNFQNNNSVPYYIIEKVIDDLMMARGSPTWIRENLGYRNSFFGEYTVSVEVKEAGNYTLMDDKNYIVHKYFKIEICIKRGEEFYGHTENVCFTTVKEYKISKINWQQEGFWIGSTFMHNNFEELLDLNGVPPYLIKKVTDDLMAARCSQTWIRENLGYTIRLFDKYIVSVEVKTVNTSHLIEDENYIIKDYFMIEICIKKGEEFYQTIETVRFTTLKKRKFSKINWQQEGF